MNPGEKIGHLKQEYTIDRRELGKIMVIASAALLLLSTHATITLQETSEKAAKLNGKLEETSNLVNTQRFNESLDALEDTKGTDLAPMYFNTVESFRSVQDTTKTAGELQENLEDRTEMYQWSILVALLGIVAGVLIIYM